MNTLYEILDLLKEADAPPLSKRLNELFLFLRNEKEILSEEAAISQFAKGTTNKKYFNQLKNRLKQKLIKYVLISPSIWVNIKDHALYDDCHKRFTAYKILLRSGKRRAAIEIAKKLLLKLQKEELHSLSYTVAIDLRFHYSGIELSANLAKKYDEIAKEQINILNAESTIRAYYSRVCLLQNSKESYTPTMIAEFKEAMECTFGYLELGSHYLNKYIYNIAIYRYMAEFDYKQVISYCEEALGSFPPEYPNSNAQRFNFIQMKIPALIATGALEEAKEVAREACKMMPVGKYNWHLALIQRVLVYLHSGDYQEAYNLYKEQEKYDCSYPVLGEYWKIIWGYLYFLIRVERIEEYTKERFFLGKFLNEVPLYSKDKRGNNINILIIQILTRLYKDHYGRIIDSIDALDIYARTYTRNPETVRANLFIKMILKMSAASFHREATERKTQKLLEQLKAMPLSLGQNLAIEMIPYEILWEEILTMLDNKFRGSTARQNKDMDQPESKKDH